MIRPIPPIPRFTTRSLIAAAITWSILVLVSILHIARYENTPGTASAQAATQINPLSQSRPPQDLHIELFIHPRCPCSAATLEQLATIDAARQPRRLIAWVYIPKDAPASWISGNTTTALRDTLHADIRLDVDGSHARSLGITTSGHILICDESGTPFFSGGITNSRGNPAPSQGAAAIHAWLNLGHGIPFTPVFGCGLLGDAHE